MSERPPPSPEELQREIELVRSVHERDAASAAPNQSVAKQVFRGLRWTLLLWVLLIIMFAGIWKLFEPVSVQEVPSGTAVPSGTLRPTRPSGR